MFTKFELTGRYECSLRMVTFSSGERFPLLLDAQGLPLWYPTLFITTQLRNASKAPNTMAAALSSIRLFLTWARYYTVDLEKRFARREFLNEQELESLCRHAQNKALEPESWKPKIAKITRIHEAARGSVRIAESRVGSNTQYIRMSYMADYLEWLAVRLVERDAKQVDGDTLDRITRMAESFRKRRPIKAKASAVFARHGLVAKESMACFVVVHP